MPVRVFMGHGGPLPTKAWWTSVNEGDPFDALEEWSKCVNAAREDVDKYIQTWRNEMDTLLVFGSLYSAIVTAFVIESYQWLQVDSADSTVALLLQVSAQLADGSQPAASLSSYSPTSAQVGINALWFSSLIISLTAILLAIMIKQWLSEYTSPSGTASPRHTLAIRQARVDNLKDWHINTLVDWLPMLFISSLFLFFAGLATLLYTYNRVVGSISIGLVSIPTLFFMTTSILPVFFPSCSYRSVQAFIAVIVLGPIVSFFTKDRLVWDIREAWRSSAKRAQVEPRALLWILRTICPWKPSLYPVVATCTRSLGPTVAARTACDLYRYSIMDESDRFTKVQARRWQLLIGSDEFEMTCSLLADGAQSLPGGPEWAGVEAEDLVDYVKTTALFFTLFSPEYLKSGGRFEEFYPAPVFRKGLKLLVDIAIGDRLPKTLSLAYQDELERFVLRQLEVMNDFEWPKDMPDGEASPPVSELLLPLTAAAIRARQSDDTELFITLSTVALGTTRRMKDGDLRDNRECLHRLLQQMAMFAGDYGKDEDSSVLKSALSRWMAILYTGYTSGDTSEGRAINCLDLNDSTVQTIMGDFMKATQMLPSAIWGEDTKYGHRLRIGFGSAEDISRAFLDSAPSEGDAWADVHREFWKTTLTSGETSRAINTLLNTAQQESKQGPDLLQIRVLCQLLPNIKDSSPLIYPGISYLLDLYSADKPSHESTPGGSDLRQTVILGLERILRDVFNIEGHTYYYGDKTEIQLSISLQRILSVVLQEARNTRSNASLMMSPLSATVLEALTCVNGGDFPGATYLQTQATELLQVMQGIVTDGTPGAADLVIQWVRAIRNIPKRNALFYDAEQDEDARLALRQALGNFLLLVQSEKGIMMKIGADPAMMISFRNMCALFGALPAIE